jgi:hypothetical protein
MERIVVDECFELMRRAPLLEILSLSEILRSSGVFAIPTARIMLPRLRRLSTLYIVDESVVAELLDSMCAPSLKIWDYQSTGHSSYLNNVMSFIEHSSFSLKTFNVGGGRYIHPQFHRILHLLPSLEFLKLRFRDREVTDAVLNWLCASNDSSPFLPCLQTLELTHQLPFPWESLLQLFSSSNRWSLAVKVDQETHVLLTTGTAEKLLKLVDEGFNITILRYGKVDVLEEYRGKRRLSQTAY